MAKGGVAKAKSVNLPLDQVDKGAQSQRSARKKDSPGRKVQSARAVLSNGDGTDRRGSTGSGRLSTGGKDIEEKKEKKEKTTVGESDDRLAELRSELFLLLRSRQQELAKELVRPPPAALAAAVYLSSTGRSARRSQSCSLCNQPLVRPPPGIATLCSACAYKSVRYFGECPCCERSTNGTKALSTTGTRRSCAPASKRERRVGSRAQPEKRVALLMRERER